MASVTTSTPVASPIPAPVTLGPLTVLIEPPYGWLDPRLADVWEYREQLYFFVWRDVKVRYKQTVIGVLWVVLQPLLTMGVFTIFFGRLAKLPSEGLPYPVFYFAALVPWAYFSVSLSMCTGILVSNQHVITKVYFPRLVLPLAAVYWLAGSGHRLCRHDDHHAGVRIPALTGQTNRAPYSAFL
jgi:lipopolysaccharide transport system permease protein